MRRNFAFLLIAILLLISCAQYMKRPTQDAAKQDQASLFSADQVNLFEIFVPVATTQPATYVNRLATIFLDKQSGYTIHAMACDRLALLSMFSDPTTRFYLLNTTYTWLWGDGTSSYESEVTHAYPMAGKYNVVIQIEMSFRGGYKYRVNGALEIDVPNPLPDEDIIISGLESADFSGTTETPPETKIIVVSNIGGRPVIATPKITQTDGEMPEGWASDWVSITPTKANIIDNGPPVEFYLLLDWPSATPGHTNINITFIISYFTSGWHIPYVSGTLVPP